MQEQFKKRFQNLKIETMANGYLVYPNENIVSLNNTIREIPYVFETKENLFKFIEENLNIKN